jgi:hypothetical protein
MNIAIKKIRENKRKDQTRTQDVMEFGLKMHKHKMSPGLPTSNN